MNQGTPRELLPLSEKVLVWVAEQKLLAARTSRDPDQALLDDLRRIELCALATREACLFFDLYGLPGLPHKEGT